MAAITAAFCVGPEAHPDPARRYWAPVSAGIFYLLIGFFGATVAGLFAAFPKEHRSTKYEVEPFDASFHLRAESEWAPEVQLTVHIVHREGYLRPLDECEKRCADEIQKALRGLGVQPKSWPQTRRVGSAS